MITSTKPFSRLTFLAGLVAVAAIGIAPRAHAATLGPRIGISATSVIPHLLSMGEHPTGPYEYGYGQTPPPATQHSPRRRSRSYHPHAVTCGTVTSNGTKVGIIK